MDYKIASAWLIIFEGQEERQTGANVLVSRWRESPIEIHSRRVRRRHEKGYNGNLCIRSGECASGWNLWSYIRCAAQLTHFTIRQAMMSKRPW
jgi:hypothetical protein